MVREDPAAPLDPYASPQADSGQVPPSWSDREPFGLTQPIHAAGEFSFDDVRQAFRLERRSVKTGRLLGVLLLTALWCSLEYAFRGPANLWSLTLGTVVAMGIAFMLLVWLAGRIAKARLGRYLVGDNQRREMVFGEETVTIRSATTDVVGAWTMFSKCTCSPLLVLLHVFPYTERQIIPRSFFVTQEDWDLFVRLAQHKLPEDAPLPAPTNKGLPELVEDVTNQTSGICGQGVLQLSEMCRAARYAPGYWTWKVLSAGMFVVTLLPTVYAASVAGPLSAMQFAPGILGATLVVWGFFIQPRRQLTARVQNRPECHVACTLTVSEERLQIDTYYSRALFRWDCFRCFQNLGDLVLLHFRMGDRTQMVPASFFTESDWQRLLQLVARKLPEK